MVFCHVMLEKRGLFLHHSGASSRRFLLPPPKATQAPELFHCCRTLFSLAISALGLALTVNGTDTPKLSLPLTWWGLVKLRSSSFFYSRQCDDRKGRKRLFCRAAAVSNSSHSSLFLLSLATSNFHFLKFCYVLHCTVQHRILEKKLIFF